MNTSGIICADQLNALTGIACRVSPDLFIVFSLNSSLFSWQGKKENISGMRPQASPFCIVTFHVQYI